MKKYIVLIGLIIFIQACSTSQNGKKQAEKDSFWLRVETDEGLQGYISPAGDTVIEFGKYNHCFTDTFRTYAIVASEKKGLIGINRAEKQLFEVFVYDNGPDYVEDGLFRIKEGEKIGYANTSGEIVIPPQFICAFPFQNGKAKVALNCTTKQDGEHRFWESDNWFFIDKSGNRIEE